MILEKQKLGNIENVTVAVFGEGTLKVTSGTSANKDYRSLLIGTNPEPVTIGEVLKTYTTTDEFEPKISLVFKNEESFSVFEHYVKIIRSQFDNQKKL